MTPVVPSLDEWTDELRRLLELPGLAWPLPPLPRPPAPRSRGRRGRKRWHDAVALWEVAERARRSLNFLMGKMDAAGQEMPPGGKEARIRAGAGPDSPEALLHGVWLQLLSAAKRVREVRRRSSSTGAPALAELGGDMSESYQRAGSLPVTAKYADFVGDRMDEPPAGTAGIPLLAVLPPWAAELYGQFEKLVPPLCEDRSAQLRRDNAVFQKVLGSRDEYIKYLWRAEARDLFCLRPVGAVRAWCSVAAVPKRSGDQLRKILMVCPFNAAAVTVYEMMAAARAAGCSEVPDDDDLYGMRGPNALAQVHTAGAEMFTCTADESSAFTYLEVPEPWWVWQACPRVLAGELPADWRQPGWTAGTVLAPCYKRLPMGFTHSVLLLMLVNDRAIVRAMARVRTELRVIRLNRSAEWAAGGLLDGRTVALYLHVDDFGIFGGRGAACERFLEALVAELTALGFRVKVCHVGEVERFIGLTPQSRPPALLLASDALLRLDAGLAALEQAEGCLGPLQWALLETTVGRFAYAALLWKPAMSVLHATYTLLSGGWRYRPLWSSVRCELAAARGLLPFLAMRLDRPLAALVTCQDAAGPTEDGTCSTGAFCLAAACPEVAAVRCAAWRAEVQGRRSLASALPDPEAWLEPVETLPMTVLPKEWFSPTTPWSLLLARRWRWHCHINQGEARARNVWAALLAKMPTLRGHDVLNLSDSMVAVGLFHRGRSPAHNLNGEARRSAAWEAASGVRLTSTWVDTDHQPADGGTRPDEFGRLALSRPAWCRPAALLEVSFEGIGLAARCALRGLRTARAWDLRGVRPLSDPRLWRKLMSALISGHISLLWLVPPTRACVRACAAAAERESARATCALLPRGSGGAGDPTSHAGGRSGLLKGGPGEEHGGGFHCAPLPGIGANAPPRCGAAVMPVQAAVVGGPAGVAGRARCAARACEESARAARADADSYVRSMRALPEVLDADSQIQATNLIIRAGLHIGAKVIVAIPEFCNCWGPGGPLDACEKLPFLISCDSCAYGVPWKRRWQLQSNWPAVQSLEARCECAFQCSHRRGPHAPVPTDPDARRNLMVGRPPFLLLDAVAHLAGGLVAAASDAGGGPPAV